jgi:ABC-type polysaccharide/polyol phosphate transport system ATPase subunit
MTHDTAITINGVSKYYKLYTSPKERFKEALHPFSKTLHRKFYALRDIHLEIYSGEVFGIVGRNASGKSTLLKVIAGVLEPNSGSLTIHGSISAMLELGVGFNPKFTGLQNVYFYGTLLGFSREEIEAKLESILGFAEIGDFIHQPIHT